MGGALRMQAKSTKGSFSTFFHHFFSFQAWFHFVGCLLLFVLSLSVIFERNSSKNNKKYDSSYLETNYKL